MGLKKVVKLVSGTALFTSLGLGALSLISIQAHGGEAAKSLSLVYDQKTNQYFIGRESKLLLKEGAQTGPVEKIEVSVDGGEFYPYSEGIQFESEGKHSLKFRALNPVNNWSPVQFIQVFVDLTPPTTDAKFSEERYFKDESGLYVGVNSTISLTAQDNLSGIGNIEWAWAPSEDSDANLNFTPYSKPIVVDGAGKRTLVFRSMDRVGNTESSKKVSFFADSTPPISNLKIQGNSNSVLVKGQTYLSDAAAFSIEASDDSLKVKQIWVEIDGKPQVYIKPIYFLQEGRHTLSYYSVDQVGNKEQKKTFSVYTVARPPHTTLQATGKIVNTGGINFATKDFQAKLIAGDSVVGLDRIEVKTDEAPEFHSYLEPIRFSKPGIHYITYRAVDRVGNMEPAKTFTVNIHELAPETTYSTAQPLITKDGVTYSPTPNILTFNVGTSPVGIQETLISINDEKLHKYSGPITLTSKHKVYKIAYKSIDKLGNEEKTKLLTINMISTVPIVDLFISNGKSSEEQVRTNYLDEGISPGSRRAPASK